MSLTREQIIAKFGMQPHPEGGHFVETFRSAVTVQTPLGERSASTAIYFLISQGESSNLHRIQSEEVWHYYAGAPTVVVELLEGSGGFKATYLGPDINNGQVLQHVVPANVWFGAYVDSQQHTFSLVGCTVAPGFDFQDFELGQRARLLSDFPAARDVVLQLTRDEASLAK